MYIETLEQPGVELTKQEEKALLTLHFPTLRCKKEKVSSLSEDEKARLGYLFMCCNNISALVQPKAVVPYSPVEIVLELGEGDECGVCIRR